MPTAPSIPFPIASRVSTRQAFSTSIISLGAAPTVINPIQIPAVGYLRSIILEVTVTGTGGTSPAWLADAPYNVLQSVNFRTASGNDIIVPVTGYQLMLINKYGGYRPVAANDPRNPVTGYVAATPTAAHFFLRIPLEIDPTSGFCALPALAGNRPYMLNMTVSPTASVASGGPSLTVQINGYSEFWQEPTGTTRSGTGQETEPLGLGSISKWELEIPSVNPGDRLLKLNNVGNTLRTYIFTTRNASGQRIGVGAAAGFTGTVECQFYVDNEMLFAFMVSNWEQYMAEWFGLTNSTFDAYGGLDTGVYVLPFHALVGDSAGDPSNSRSQLLPTLNASQIQLRTTYGTGIATLECLTNSVVPVTGTGMSALYSK